MDISDAISVVLILSPLSHGVYNWHGLTIGTLRGPVVLRL